MPTFRERPQLRGKAKNIRESGKRGKSLSAFPVLYPGDTDELSYQGLRD
jgi:hypothetical protein